MADWWSYGTLLNEFFGIPPFLSENMKIMNGIEISKNI